MTDFDGQTALVTGGAQGIGRVTAAHLLRRGMRVVIMDVNEDAGRHTLEQLAPLGPVHFVRADVSEPAQVQRAVQEAVDFGGALQGLVNNAAAGNQPLGGLETLSLEAWNRVLAVNLGGAMLCSRFAAPHLREGSGAIVNVASTRALMSEPHGEAYAASKGGLVALTHAMAVSLGPAIRVNCISPGWIDVRRWKFPPPDEVAELSADDHAQHPAGRVGRPEDVAELVEFLLSHRSGFMTGQNLVLDGGVTRRMRYAE